MSKTEVKGYIKIQIHNPNKQTNEREEQDINAFIRIDNIIMVTESWRRSGPLLTKIHLDGERFAEFTKETVEEVMEKIKNGILEN